MSDAEAGRGQQSAGPALARIGRTNPWKGKEVSNYLWDLAAAAGVLLVAAGLWWIYPPLALIVVGLLLATFGVWGAKIFAKGRPRLDD
jgi:hypothetical protein